MDGHVDDYGRALIAISIRPPEAADRSEIVAWVDTGFNGDLVLPRERIEALALRPSGTLKALLADGSEAVLRRYACLIDWFGEERDLEVVANDGEHPLLGVGLLVGHDLQISYRTGKVKIDGGST